VAVVRPSERWWVRWEVGLAQGGVVSIGEKTLCASVATLRRRRPQCMVILGFMSDTKHAVLIHGTWGRGDSWGPARTAFEERDYTVHTPTLRHHELPLAEGATKIAPLSLRDYVDDLVALVESIDSPPLLVGISLGGLLAQLVAARTDHAGSSQPVHHLRQEYSPRVPRHRAPSEVSSGATFCARGPGVNPSIHLGGNDFDDGSPTRRPRKPPASHLPTSCAHVNRAASTAK
jgi:hypothetical protein